MLAPRPDRILSVAALSSSDRSKVRGLLLFGRAQLLHPWRLADDHTGADVILWPGPETSLGSVETFVLAAPHWWTRTQVLAPSGLSNAPSKVLPRGKIKPSSSFTSRFKAPLECPPDLLEQPELEGCQVSCWNLDRMSSETLLPALDDLDSWIRVQVDLPPDDVPNPIVSESLPLLFQAPPPVSSAPLSSSITSDSAVLISTIQRPAATMPNIKTNDPSGSTSSHTLPPLGSLDTDLPQSLPHSILPSGSRAHGSANSDRASSNSSVAEEPKAPRSWLSHLVDLAKTPIPLPRVHKGATAVSQSAERSRTPQPTARRLGKLDADSDIRVLLVGSTGAGKSTAVASVTTAEVGVANGSGVASLGAARPGSEFSRVTDQGLCLSGEVRVWLSAITATRPNGSPWPLSLVVPGDNAMEKALPDLTDLLETCDAVLVLVDASRPDPLEELKTCLIDLSILPPSGVPRRESHKAVQKDPLALPPSSIRAPTLINGRLGYRPVLVAYTHLDDGSIPLGFRAALSEMMGFQSPVLPMDPRDRSAVTRAVALLSGSAVLARTAHALAPAASTTKF